jgi:DNA-binding MarR family transcriptional regulator
MDDDDDLMDGWPREPVRTHDTRVVDAVHGAYHSVMRRLALSTREHGIEPVEALALVVLLREPGCPPWQIRRRLGLHRSTLSSLLDRLEKDGRIERRIGGFAGRRFEIHLTNAGGISADIADLVIGDVEDEIAGYTSLAERHAARAVFEASVAIGVRDRHGYG